MGSNINKTSTVLKINTSQIWFWTCFFNLLILNYLTLREKFSTEPGFEPRFPVMYWASAGFSTSSTLGEISTAPPNCNSNPNEKMQRI